MGGIFPAQVLVHPHFYEPGLIIQYNQASGAFNLLAGGDPLIKLGEDDLFVYMNRLDVRTQIQGGQSRGNQLPSCDVIASNISCPTYLFSNRAEWDHHDIAAASRYHVSLPEAQRMACRQGHFQNMRNGLLYGFNAANGEGLLNANGATTVNLPPDSNGNVTVSTYDNGQMAFFIANTIGQIKTRMMNLGLAQRVSILMPQRIGELWGYNVVQLTQYQRTGAGVRSTMGTVQDILAWNEDSFDIGYDDTLIGKGANGTDAVIITIPEVKKAKANKINTNVFAEVEPGIEACVTMYADMAAPREIQSPLAGGAVDLLTELRVTPGWVPRSEAITIINMQFQ